MVHKSGPDFLSKFPVHRACLADINALRNRLVSGTVCQLCYKILDRINRRRRGQNKNKQTSKFIPIGETSTCLQKHIFAMVLSRNDIFKNETPENHRFTEKLGFKICRVCHTTSWNYFKNLRFSNETSDYFSFFRPASNPDQAGSSQSLRGVGPPEDNFNVGPSQDQPSNDVIIERLSQEFEQLSQNAGSVEPDSIEDPDSDIEFDFHPPPEIPNEDAIPDSDSSQSNSQSSSSDSQPIPRSLTYFNTKNKYISIVDCSNIDTSKCVICGHSPSAIEEVILLNNELVYDCVDNFKVGLKNWSELNFICDTCHPTSDSFSDSSLELVKAKSPPKKSANLSSKKGFQMLILSPFMNNEPFMKVY